jgi:hypothetical protein
MSIPMDMGTVLVVQKMDVYSIKKTTKEPPPRSRGKLT